MPKHVFGTPGDHCRLNRGPKSHRQPNTGQPEGPESTRLQAGRAGTQRSAHSEWSFRPAISQKSMQFLFKGIIVTPKARK